MVTGSTTCNICNVWMACIQLLLMEFFACVCGWCTCFSGAISWWISKPWPPRVRMASAKQPRAGLILKGALTIVFYFISKSYFSTGWISGIHLYVVLIGILFPVGHLLVSFAPCQIFWVNGNSNHNCICFSIFKSIPSWVIALRENCY